MDLPISWGNSPVRAMTHAVLVDSRDLENNRTIMDVIAFQLFSEARARCAAGDDLTRGSIGRGA